AVVVVLLERTLVSVGPRLLGLCQLAREPEREQTTDHEVTGGERELRAERARYGHRPVGGLKRLLRLADDREPGNDVEQRPEDRSPARAAPFEERRGGVQRLERAAGSAGEANPEADQLLAARAVRDRPLALAQHLFGLGRAPQSPEEVARTEFGELAPLRVRAHPPRKRTEFH